jgi:hypothetical protein
MTARHRGWFQYEYGATNLAIHFLTSMITDISLDGDGHETDPHTPDILVAPSGAGNGYPTVAVWGVDCAGSVKDSR